MAVLLYLAAAAGSPDIAIAVSEDVARQDCKPLDGEEILVCGRRRPDERYRLPGRDGPFDPAGDTYSVMREKMSWLEEGDTGIQSCGAVGPASWTGCAVKAWKRERDQTQWGKNVPKRR